MKELCGGKTDRDRLYFRNIFLATVSSDAPHRRKKRMSEPFSEMSAGAIYVALSDGRYAKKIIDGRLEMITAIVALPQLARICYADAGLEAKIECANMDGDRRQVNYM